MKVFEHSMFEIFVKKNFEITFNVEQLDNFDNFSSKRKNIHTSKVRKNRLVKMSRQFENQPSQPTSDCVIIAQV